MCLRYTTSTARQGACNQKDKERVTKKIKWVNPLKRISQSLFKCYYMSKFYIYSLFLRLISPKTPPLPSPHPSIQKPYTIQLSLFSNRGSTDQLVKGVSCFSKITSQELEQTLIKLAKNKNKKVTLNSSVNCISNLSLWKARNPPTCFIFFHTYFPLKITSTTCFKQKKIPGRL